MTRLFTEVKVNKTIWVSETDMKGILKLSVYGKSSKRGLKNRPRKFGRQLNHFGAQYDGGRNAPRSSSAWRTATSSPRKSVVSPGGGTRGSAASAPPSDSLSGFLGYFNEGDPKSTSDAFREGVGEYVQSGRAGQDVASGTVKALSGLGSKAIAAGTALSLVGVVYGAKKLKDKIKANANWNKVKQSYPHLNTKKDKENYQILVEYAPALTLQPRVAASYLMRAKEQHLMPHEFIKDLVDITAKRDRGALSSVITGKL